MNEVQHPGFDKSEKYETFTTTNGLKEAAENRVTENGRFKITSFEKMRIEDILFGAEWMAKQGETQEHFVIGSIAGSSCGPAIVCYTKEFAIGDEVIVQIRKKEE